MIIGQAEGRLASVEDQTPAGETKAQHEFKVQAVKEFSSRFTRLIKEGT